jgi:hypothetical protein
MSISSRRAGASRLCEAVDAYRAEQNKLNKKAKLEEWALELLDRLARSPEAAEAFGRLKLKDGRERDFLMLCILVGQLAREFPARISTEQKMLARLKRLDKAIAKLRSFVEEQMTQFSDFVIPQFYPIPAWGFIKTIGGSPDDFKAVNAMTGGLDLIAKLIEKRRHIGKTVITAWRATRKTHPRNAAYLAAIKILGNGTRALTGKAHKRELRELAPMILGTDLPAAIDRLV